MRVVFWRTDKLRERLLADAMAEGVRAQGDDFEIRHTRDYGDEQRYEGPCDATDVAVVCGVKPNAKRLLHEHVAAGRHCFIVDKGYIRRKGPQGIDEYHRFSLDAFQPLAYFQRRPRPADRWQRLRLALAPPRKKGGHVVFAGSSQKYGNWHGLGDATAYAVKLVRRIGKLTSRRIVYRPKPSWAAAVPVPGAAFSRRPQTLGELLVGAHALVTHGSNAALEAVLAGVPAIVLGEGIARPVAEAQLECLETPRFADEAARLQWAADFSYCQWTLAELRSGEAWQHLRETVLQAGR